MNIKERLSRNNFEDQKYFGDLVESHYLNSEFGELFDALLNARSAEILEGRRTDKDLQGLSDAETVGMLRAFQKIKNDLENYVIVRDELNKPIEKEEKSGETYTPDNYGGSV